MSERDLISIQDLSIDEIRSLFAVADRMQRLLRESHGQLAGHIMGSLFLEPSTRTRLSFESAMNRLGGRVLTISDANASSFSKGESLADSVRMVSSYADLIVLRHPLAGAARLAADVAPVPVINAGDGGHEHPTQTLCDLYALRNLKAEISGLKVVVYGDLKYGRTTHSLALALARFGADCLCVSEPGLELPEYVREDCAAMPGVTVRSVAIAGMERIFGPAGARGLLIAQRPDDWLAGPERVHLSDLEIDAIYVTRLQRERLQQAEQGMDAHLPNVDVAFLRAPPFREAVVLHPLPRREEIHVDVDRDPRSAYFRQAAWGVPIRMALISYLLGKELTLAGPPPARPEQAPEGPGRCANASCVTAFGAEPRVRVGAAGGGRCAYCDLPCSV